ncbi:hypothetical protein RB195_023501 [Necator americanus]|uniref:Uncharacterized protein n=1 Tax=Necator americanus TaxID=51031 RepID=A0ABR1EJF2_NECAM
MEKIDCMERKLLRRLLAYLWPMVYHNEELYSEMDMGYRRMTRGKHQHLALSPEVVTENRFCLLGHVLKRPSGRLAQVILEMLPDRK